MSLGFTFNNVHSAQRGVVFRSVDRTLLPQRRLTQYVIPGASGTYDVVGGYENRQIVCELSFVGEQYQYEGVRSRARAIASWLSGEGLLAFDDEPGKSYRAKVTGGISIEQIAVTGHCQVTFLCEPFALGTAVQQAISTGSNRVSYDGTADTPMLLVLHNNNNYAVTNVTVTVTKKRG